MKRKISISETELNIKAIKLEIKNYEIQREYIISMKPFIFQRNKMKKYEKELEKITKKIFECYRELYNEVNK